MEPEKLYQYLTELAEKLNISIRYDDIASPDFMTRSGLCRIRGRYVYIMDANKSLTEKIELLAKCLSEMNLEDIYVVPALRNLLRNVHKNP